MRVGSRAVRRALVASEDRELRAFVAGVVRGVGRSVTEARGLREAVLMLSSRPDVLLFGTELASGRSFELVTAANQTRPVPIRIAIGSMLIAEDAFELARRGIATLLPRPPAAREIVAAIQQAPGFDTMALLADLVGRIELADLVAGVREAMRCRLSRCRTATVAERRGCSASPGRPSTKPSAARARLLITRGRGHPKVSEDVLELLTLLA